MSKFFHQLHFKQYIGYFCIPASLIFLLIHFRLWEENFTGLLSNPTLRIYMMVYGLLLLIYINVILYKYASSIRIVIFDITAVLSFVIPYSNFPTLHLLFSYGSFIIFQAIWLPCIIYQRRYFSLYVLLVFTCAMLIITTSSINGLSEMIYAICMSILLTRFHESSSQINDVHH